MTANVYEGMKCLGVIKHARFNMMKTEITGEWDGDLEFREGSQTRPLEVWVNNKQAMIRCWVTRYPYQFGEIVILGVRVKEDSAKKRGFGQSRK